MRARHNPSSARKSAGLQFYTLLKYHALCTRQGLQLYALFFHDELIQAMVMMLQQSPLGDKNYFRFSYLHLIIPFCLNIYQWMPTVKIINIDTITG